MIPADELQQFRLSSAFRGQSIYGDDFSNSEIIDWFEDERHGYSSLGHEDAQTRFYAYNALDRHYILPHLPRVIEEAMGLGSAFGLEFAGLADRIKNLSIVEPEKKYWSNRVSTIPAVYHMPRPDGRLAFEDNRFGLVTVFGVLHHIPNVSAVVGELSRVLRPDGMLVVREPIVSMGDWRRPRPGLTRRERGLPAHCFCKVADRCGLKVHAAYQMGFGPLLKTVAQFKHLSPWNSAAFTLLDRVFCFGTRWNYVYHRTKFWQKFAPSIGVWILTKSR